MEGSTTPGTADGEPGPPPGLRARRADLYAFRNALNNRRSVATVSSGHPFEYDIGG